MALLGSSPTINAGSNANSVSVLIGGATSYDANDAALLAIISVWKLTTDSYANRAAYILGAKGTSGLNAS